MLTPLLTFYPQTRPTPGQKYSDLGWRGGPWVIQYEPARRWDSNHAIMMYMTTLPVADARANLSKLIDEASTTHERFEITRNGRRAAVLIGADDYDAMRETIAVLSDPTLLRAHEEGQQALIDGDVLDAEQLADAMNNAGRPVDTR